MSIRAQHRAQREENTRQLAELKKENKNLKKQIAKLRKNLTLSEQETNNFTYEVENQEIKETVKAITCPHCSSDQIHTYVTPNGNKITGCRACRKLRQAA